MDQDGGREQEEIIFLPVRRQLTPDNLPLPLGTRSGHPQVKRILASLPSLHLPVPGSGFKWVPLASVYLTHRQAHQSHQEHGEQVGHDGDVTTVLE